MVTFDENRDHLKAGVRHTDVSLMGEAEVEALLFKRPAPAILRPMPDWAEVAVAMSSRSVTLLLVWQEYRDEHADGYSYSQFRRHYRTHQKLAPEPRMRRTLLPAQMCEVDYAGMTMTVITDLDAKQRRLAWQSCADVRGLGRFGSQAGAGQSEDGRHPSQLLRSGADTAQRRESRTHKANFHLI